MGTQTREQYNQQILVGFEDVFGKAWHYDPAAQGDESNHYPGAIPAADVSRRLFHWQAASRRVFVEVPADLADLGAVPGITIAPDGTAVRLVEVPNKQGITRDDTDQVLGIHSGGYAIHQYDEWFLQRVSTLLSDTLVIQSAGLLDDGAKAWVQVQAVDTIETPQGVAFRPTLLATGSHDGSLASTYKVVQKMVVCDNTREMALREGGATVKVRHSRYSDLRLNDARQALGVLERSADEFSAEVAALCAEEVTPKTWDAFLGAVSPIPEKEGRGRTMAEAKRDQLENLWRNDLRVTPWQGTAFGVVQAMNTWAHHVQSARGATRYDRNMQRAISGGVAKLDKGTLDTLRIVQNTLAFA